MKTISSSLFHRLVMPEHTTGTVHPTLVLLHGRGADEEDLLGLAPYFDERLLLLSVRAPFPFSFGGGYTWYEFDEMGTPEPQMFISGYDKLKTFTADALNAYPIDKSRLFLLGFSMGTVMSYSLALTLPAMFRGVVANSGYVPERTGLEFRWNELDNVEFFVAHGSADPVIPLSFGRRAKELLDANGARFTYKEYPMGHQISEESLADSAAWLRQRLNT